MRESYSAAGARHSRIAANGRQHWSQVLSGPHPGRGAARRALRLGYCEGSQNVTNFVKCLRSQLAAASLGLTLGAVSSGVAMAAQPQPWEIYLQPPGTEVMTDIHWFGDFTMWIVGLITLMVLGLLITVMVKFNAKANPVPSKTTHNTMIEVVWTVAPILILLIIAIPSFRLLFKEVVIPPADMTVKVTGSKWYWSYEYPDNEDIAFDSYMVEEADITDPVKQPRLLAVDNPMVVPVGKTVRVQVTGADVIHSFAMPSFGIKIDAMPGRLNETWFKADAEGVYYGQCSELCGQRHAFMPIAIHVVSDDQFQKWAAVAKDDIDEATKLLAEMEDGSEPQKVAAR
ncbi:Cytochrome c oxidase subunit 2 precursor [Hartmannibacter diazotrophicus]|uniref:Cytochrome c oxidase subunit 2 n=1 Tax=Hartmannibacter diazotrophicus TaxID=1482074 RepID=A0A2C9D571_9HYPH|nr:Cytochrome c oxidase subunit 2 precursor [Hartmannibacter diazotrophicus]